MSSAATSSPPPRHRPTVDIVIVNWNSGACLGECLRSIVLADQSVVELQRVVVVDNRSTDDSLDGSDGLPLPLVVLRNPDNRGFAAACNQGARNSRARYLLFLNPDTRLLPDSLTIAGELMESEEAARVGICGGQMLGDDGSPAVSCSRFPTLRTYLGKMTGLTVVLPSLFPDQHLSAAETRSSQPVDQVIGAFFFVRRSVFSELNGFDERYFMYMEDVDFSLRASRSGYSSYFLSNLRVYHRGNVSSDQVRGDRLFYLLRSRDLYAAEHWPRWRATLLVVLNVAVGLPARLLRAALVGRRRDDLGTSVEGYHKYLVHRVFGRTGRPARRSRGRAGEPRRIGSRSEPGRSEADPGRHMSVPSRTGSRASHYGGHDERAAQEEVLWTYGAT